MKKILLVDDEPQIIKMYKSRFEDAGYEVETAKNGLEGLIKIDEFFPDLILLDILMPRVNGLDMLTSLKSDNLTKNIPVILLTNVGGSQEDVNRGLTLGATAYMIKSNYTSKEILEKVDEIMEATVREKPDKLPEVKTQIREKLVS